MVQVVDDLATQRARASVAMILTKFTQNIPASPPDELVTIRISPDSKVCGDNMGPIWGRQDPGGPHVGPMNFAIWVRAVSYNY